MAQQDTPTGAALRHDLWQGCPSSTPIGRDLGTPRVTPGGRKCRRGIGEQRLVGPYTADARLNGVPVAVGKVSYFELFPDGAGLVYRADETADEKFELFTADLRLLGDGFEEGDSDAWGDLP